MKDSNNLPNSINHKKLSYLLSQAPKDTFSYTDSEHDNTKSEEIYEIIDNWESLTRNLIEQISKEKKKVHKNKSSNALIALGAMEAHLNMAMHALNSFKNDHNDC
tara:strand:- start:341 stop:655 length:315 start_codon:yes stop_codon:yes gene_type:complete